MCLHLNHFKDSVFLCDCRETNDSVDKMNMKHKDKQIKDKKGEKVEKTARGKMRGKQKGGGAVEPSQG